jgi:hypothetical protein
MSMRSPSIRIVLGALCSVALLGMMFARGPRDEARLAKEFQPLAVADIQPGDGLGIMRLGMSTLKTFTEFFPVRTTLPYRIEGVTGIELRYPKQGLYFLFNVTPQCLDSIPDLGALGAALRTNAAEVFKSQPSCGAGTLESITLTYPTEPDTAQPFARGMIDHNIGLGTPYRVVDSLLGPSDGLTAARVVTLSDLGFEFRAQERSYRHGLRVAMAKLTHGSREGRIVVQRIDIVKPDTTSE